MRVSIPYWKRRKFEPNVIYIDSIVASFEVLGHSVVATTHGITIEPATDDDDDDDDDADEDDVP